MPIIPVWDRRPCLSTGAEARPTQESVRRPRRASEISAVGSYKKWKRGRLRITFTLNGTKTEIDVQPDRRVVDLLREDLGLTGVKESCGAGDCGACTILVEGESRLSCLMLAAQLQDRAVTTVEGLASGETLHVIQSAFVEHGAVQCGFCIPGMALAATDFLNRNPNPSRQEIREGLAGNLCRCTGYQKIVDAVGKAAESQSDEDAP
jgi:aerobic carbon-monoxide dehydrogenase small subunit